MKLHFLPLIITLLVFFSCKQQKTSENVSTVTTTEFKENIEKKPGIILDVRPENMFKSGHIQNAISLDYGNDNFKSELEKLDKNTPIYVYCNAGYRSGKTANMLGEMGFKKVVDLKDGLNDWKEKGNKVVTD